MKRLQIVSVVQSTEQGHLKLCCEEAGFHSHNYFVELQGFWSKIDYATNDIIHVFGEFINNVCSVSDTMNFLVLQPDILVSCTTISAAIQCPRRALLSQFFKYSEEPNIHMFVGSLVHRLFQEALISKISFRQDLLLLAKSFLKQFATKHMMSLLKTTETEILEKLSSYLTSVGTFIDRFIKRQEAIPRRNGLHCSRNVDKNRIVGLYGVEENIWCTSYGLRGMVDVTLEVADNDRTNSNSKLMPLELKTGRSTFGADHRAQVGLYTLMMSDVHSTNVTNEGLLLYLNDLSTEMIALSHNDLRGVLQLRNEIAHYLSRQTTKENRFFALPPMIDNPRTCNRCPHALSCCLVKRSSCDSQNSEECGEDLVQVITKHLSEQHLEFFAKWMACLYLEWKASNLKQPLSRIWLSEPTCRAPTDCITKLTVLTVENSSGFSIIHFRAFNENEAASDVTLSIGDIVVLSNDTQKRLAIAIGSISSIASGRISVKLEKPLVLNDAKDSFRLNKYPSGASFSLCFSNLSKLMSDTESSASLRNVLIQKHCITTTNVRTPFLQRDVLRHLNKYQLKAIIRSLTAEKFVLIQGMPGCGKTQTIVALIELLYRAGSSVLLTSYTHSAVDTVLLRLIVKNIPFLRFGSSSQIHPSCLKNSFETVVEAQSAVSDAESIYNSAKIVACTCLAAASDPFIMKRVFDYCILDEATLTTVPAGIAPLLCCKRFVLIGDPMQLNPLSISAEVRETKMNKSIFAELMSAESIVELPLQYRMNSEIMRLSNLLFYNNKLLCGNKAVKCCCLQVHNYELLDAPDWIKLALSPNIEHSVIFLNTEKLASSHHKHGSSLCNFVEATVIAEVCTNAIAQLRISPGDIGVVCMYRPQCDTVKKTLLSRLDTNIVERLDVKTADQFQGLEKAVIIISFVWTGTEHETSLLLNDPNRVNVALTRAKHKLIMVGKVTALKNNKIISPLLNHVKETNIVHIDTR